MNDTEAILLLCVGICLFIIIPGCTLYFCRCKAFSKADYNKFTIRTVQVQNEYSQLLDNRYPLTS
jgi:hypothetical protein